jgi:Na+-translocating ferredoxin:NAD+ oxidoreductase subunit B
MTQPPAAFIDEPNCIGCALCLAVCPTDAIVGAHKYLHTVIAADCTGCERCLPVCPTDCITMRPRTGEAAAPRALAQRWRRRIRVRRARLTEERLAADRARARQRDALRGPKDR